MIRSLTPLPARLYRTAGVVPIYEKRSGPFSEGGSLIATLYVLNSVPE